MNNFLKTNFRIRLPYNFQDIISHTGVYDQQLQDDIDAWILTGCIEPKKNFNNNETKFELPFSVSNVSPTESGKIFAESRILWLKRVLGESGMIQLDQFIEEYGRLSESDLIKKENSSEII